MSVDTKARKPAASTHLSRWVHPSDRGQGLYSKFLSLTQPLLFDSRDANVSRPPPPALCSSKPYSVHYSLRHPHLHSGNAHSASMGSFHNLRSGTGKNIETVLLSIVNRFADSSPDFRRILPFVDKTGILLECMGGLAIDSDSLLVVDESANPIEGLYAVGNSMGGGFLVDYPTTIADMSHSMCLVFGYLATITESSSLESCGSRWRFCHRRNGIARKAARGKPYRARRAMSFMNLMRSCRDS